MAMLPLANEKELLKRVAQADSQAFDQLYRHYAGPLQSYIYFFSQSKQDSEEILHDVFVALWIHRGRLPEIESFKSYVYRAARNTVLNYIRKNRKSINTIILDEIQSTSSADNPLDQLTLTQNFKIANKAIEMLPPKRREVFKLSLHSRLSFEEIAIQLNISKSTVKGHYYAAVEFLKDYLKRNGAISLSFGISVAFLFNYF